MSASCCYIVIAEAILGIHVAVCNASHHHIWNRNHLCYHGMQESGLPDTLAQICNDMATNGSICEGFVYDSFTGTAFFKGAPKTTSVDPSNLCLHPNETAWLLNTGTPAPAQGNR